LVKGSLIYANKIYANPLGEGRAQPPRGKRLKLFNDTLSCNKTDP